VAGSCENVNELSTSEDGIYILFQLLSDWKLLKEDSTKQSCLEKDYFSDLVEK
jgi:hypothetical protein